MWPISLPIIFLIVFSYFPISWYGYFSSLLPKVPISHPIVFFTGFSYMTFRLTSAAIEIRNGNVSKINFWDYMSYAFFVPTALVGPINPLSNFINSLNNKIFDLSDYISFVIRILFGITKILFLGTILQSLSFESLLFDGLPHHIVDLFICGVFFYFYLYANFSGFCDIVIGSSGLMGINVSENFDNPLISRNIKDFWNRWHLTLSHFLRDTLFSILVRNLTRKFGTEHLNHIIAFSIFLVFVIIGLWHGSKLNFFLFGLSHAFGMVAHHYYTLLIKKLLNKKQFFNYNKNIYIRIVSTTINFLYISLTMILFANNFDSLMNLNLVSN